MPSLPAQGHIIKIALTCEADNPKLFSNVVNYPDIDLATFPHHFDTRFIVLRTHDVSLTGLREAEDDTITCYAASTRGTKTVRCDRKKKQHKGLGCQRVRTSHRENCLRIFRLTYIVPLD